MARTGERGTGKSGAPLHFKGCAFHRIVSNFMCQGEFVDSDRLRMGEFEM